MLSGVSGLCDQLLFLLRERGRDARRLRDRPRDRVVPQRPVPGLQVERRHAAATCSTSSRSPRTAIEALGIVLWPMVEFEADDAIAAAAGRFADDRRRRADPDLHARQGHGPARRGRAGRALGPPPEPLLRRRRRPREVGRRAGVDPGLARARRRLVRRLSRACRAGARSRPPRCSRVYGSLEEIPPQAEQVGGPEPARRARPRRDARASTGTTRCSTARSPASGRPRTASTSRRRAVDELEWHGAPRAALGGVLRRAGACDGSAPGRIAGSRRSRLIAAGPYP